MPAPYDYRLQPIDPTQSILGGVQTGLAITNLMEQRQAAQAQAQQQAQMQTALGTLMQNPIDDRIRWLQSAVQAGRQFEDEAQ